MKPVLAGAAPLERREQLILFSAVSAGAIKNTEFSATAPRGLGTGQTRKKRCRERDRGDGESITRRQILRHGAVPPSSEPTPRRAVASVLEWVIWDRGRGLLGRDRGARRDALHTFC